MDTLGKDCKLECISLFLNLPDEISLETFSILYLYKIADMNANQTLEIYKILNRYFKNEDDATRVVSDIQMIIDNRLDEKKEVLATKEDLFSLESSLKSDINRLENKINDNLKWTMGTIIAVGGLIVAMIKLL